MVVAALATVFVVVVVAADAAGRRPAVVPLHVACASQVSGSVRSVATAAACSGGRERPSVVANRRPSGLLLSDGVVAENQPAGTVVGTFRAVDRDRGERFAFALVPGAGSEGNASFVLAGA